MAHNKQGKGKSLLKHGVAYTGKNQTRASLGGVELFCLDLARCESCSSSLRVTKPGGGEGGTLLAGSQGPR